MFSSEEKPEIAVGQWWGTPNGMGPTCEILEVDWHGHKVYYQKHITGTHGSAGIDDFVRDHVLERDV